MKQRIVLFGAIWLSCCAGTNLSFAAQRPLMVAEHPASILVKGTVVDENGAPSWAQVSLSLERRAEQSPTVRAPSNSKWMALPNSKSRSSAIKRSSCMQKVA